MYFTTGKEQNIGKPVLLVITTYLAHIYEMIPTKDNHYYIFTRNYCSGVRCGLGKNPFRKAGMDVFWNNTSMATKHTQKFVTVIRQTLVGLTGSGTTGDGLTNGGCFTGPTKKIINK